MTRKRKLQEVVSKRFCTHRSQLGAQIKNLTSSKTDDGKQDAAGTKLHLCIFSPWKNNVSMKDINRQLKGAGVVPDTIERQAFWVDVSSFVSIFERAIVSREFAKGWFGFVTRHWMFASSVSSHNVFRLTSNYKNRRQDDSTAREVA